MKLKNYKERIAAIPESTKEKVRMSNRIDEILDDNIVAIEGCMRDRIRKAMEQYGKEMYEDGKTDMLDILEHQEALHTPRLQMLVKAQKELIELYDEENLSDPAWLKESELREQIKTLES